MAKRKTRSIPTVQRVQPYNPGRPWLRGRCEARVEEATARWRSRCNRDDRCERKQHYIVNGKKLCRTHAGALLLDLMLEY